MWKHILFVNFATMGYCFLTNGQSSSSLTGTSFGLADVMRDLTSLRNLLLIANQNIYDLQNNLALANKDISSLEQKISQQKAEMSELKQNQSHLTVTLRQTMNNGVQKNANAQTSGKNKRLLFKIRLN